MNMMAAKGPAKKTSRARFFPNQHSSVHVIQAVSVICKSFKSLCISISLKIKFFESLKRLQLSSLTRQSAAARTLARKTGWRLWRRRRRRGRAARPTRRASRRKTSSTARRPSVGAACWPGAACGTRRRRSTSSRRRRPGRSSTSSPRGRRTRRRDQGRRSRLYRQRQHRRFETCSP